MSGDENPTASSSARQRSWVAVTSPVPVASIATTRPMMPESTFSSLWAA